MKPQVNCFLCGKHEYEVMIIKLPVDVIYENMHLQIVGNVEEKGEYMCLPCIGYEFDEVYSQMGEEEK